MKIHVKIQNNTYEVVVGDIHARPIQTSVNGELFEVWPEESILSTSSQKIPHETGVTVPQVKIEAPTQDPAKASGEISAPIPGVIIDILVKVGDVVQYGQELCILEAMKMKNSIRANRDGVIDEILVAGGDQVSHGQTLIRFKD